MGYKKEYKSDAAYQMDSDSFSIRHALANWILHVQMPSDITSILVTIVVIFITWKIMKFVFSTIMAIVWPLVLITLFIIGVKVFRDLSTCFEWDSFFECTTDYISDKFSGWGYSAEGVTQKFSSLFSSGHK